jgi:hypothetical protein
MLVVCVESVSNRPGSSRFINQYSDCCCCTHSDQSVALNNPTLIYNLEASLRRREC